MMAPILPIVRRSDLCVRISSKGKLNARTIKRNSGGRCCVEVWWRMHFHHPDLYYRLLAPGLRELLNRIDRILQDFQDESCESYLILKIMSPAHDQLLVRLPNWEVWSDRTAIQFLGLIEQNTRAQHDGRDRILRHRGAKFQFRLQTVLQPFQH